MFLIEIFKQSAISDKYLVEICSLPILIYFWSKYAVCQLICFLTKYVNRLPILICFWSKYANSLPIIMICFWSKFANSLPLQTICHKSTDQLTTQTQFHCVLCYEDVCSANPMGNQRRLQCHVCQRCREFVSCISFPGCRNKLQLLSAACGFLGDLHVQ